MNKKFLSAILFGALMVTSTGTFVSCKDYDDDIDQINSELTEIKSQVAALQSKINDGKWITNVSPTTGGFTVTFSDGSSYTIVNGKDGANGADGAAGAAGAAGTQWTINEEGYWVCDGVATDVKAVGQDGVNGEAGADAQPEVKKEDGTWYLWNGEDWEAFTAEEAPAANVPYYYTDPTNGNYAYLVICDENGENEQTFRLPLNEGLTQINALGGTYLDIAYGRLTKDIKNWSGSKPAPKKGDYIMSQESVGLMTLQVTPVNYDLSQDKLTLVSGKGVEAPVTLGTPVAINGDMYAWSRAVSQYGMFSVPYAVSELTEDMIATYTTNEEDNANGFVPYLMIKANDAVASVGTAAYLKLNKVASTDNITYGAVAGLDRDGKATPGAAVTLAAVWADYADYTANPDAKEDWQYNGNLIYDAFVTYEGTAADSILNKVVIDGMNVTVDAEKGTTHTFKVTWMDVNGYIGHSIVPVKYQGDAPAATETITSIATSAYTATTVTKDAANSFVVDFAPYFNTLSSSDRILWNAANGGAVVTPDLNNIYYEYEAENAYGVVETKKIYLADVVESVTWLKADGKAATKLSEYAKLRVTMNTDYVATYLNEDDEEEKFVYDFGNGTFTMNVNVVCENMNKIQNIKVPFTIAAPTQTEIDKQVTFSEAFFNATDRTYTVLGTDVEFADMTASEDVDFTGAKLADGITWLYKTTTTINAEGKEVEEVVKGEDGNPIKIGFALTGKKGVEYAVSKIKVEYMSRTMQISAINVKFADEKGASITFGKALEVACDAATIKVKNAGALEDEDVDKYFTYYRLKTFSGQLVDATDVSVTNSADLKYVEKVECDEQGNLTITTATGKIANNVTEKVKATFTSEGKTYDVEFNVTVLGIAAQ